MKNLGTLRFKNPPELEFLTELRNLKVSCMISRGIEDEYILDLYQLETVDVAKRVSENFLVSLGNRSGMLIIDKDSYTLQTYKIGDQVKRNGVNTQIISKPFKIGEGEDAEWYVNLEYFSDPVRVYL